MDYGAHDYKTEDDTETTTKTKSVSNTETTTKSEKESVVVYKFWDSHPENMNAPGNSIKKNLLPIRNSLRKLDDCIQLLEKNHSDLLLDD